MNCNIIQDLIPLYIDGCCSEESRQTVKEHIESCRQCRKLHEDMAAPAQQMEVSNTPNTFRKLNDWKASILQSVLLFVSFGLITFGVAQEAKMDYGDILNGFFAFNMVIPATGFMLSLANWYFVRVYKSRRAFSNGSLLINFGLTLCAYIWTLDHYEINLFRLFEDFSFSEILGITQGMLSLNSTGIFLTMIFFVLSKTLSNQYAKMLGKE